MQNHAEIFKRHSQWINKVKYENIIYYLLPQTV